MCVFFFICRDMKGAQDALRGREWTPAISPFASLLREHVRERQLTVLSKAFTSLTLERVASMLDCDIDGAMEGPDKWRNTCTQSFSIYSYHYSSIISFFVVVVGKCAVHAGAAVVNRPRYSSLTYYLGI